MSLVLQRPNTPQNEDLYKEIKLKLRSGRLGAHCANYVIKTAAAGIMNISGVLGPTEAQHPSKRRSFQGDQANTEYLLIT